MQSIPANRLTPFLFTAILGLLVWIAFRPSVAAVEAAPIAAVQYKVVDVLGGAANTFSGAATMRQTLDGLGNEGWTLVACPEGLHTCIFKK